MKKSLREDWINQKIYELCEKETEFLWDNFTSGNAGEKHASLKKKEAEDEHNEKKRAKRMKEEKEKKLNKFKKQQTRIANGKTKVYDSDDSFRTEDDNDREDSNSDDSFFDKDKA